MRYAGAILCALLSALLAAAVLAGATLSFDDAARSAFHRHASSDLTELARLFSFVGEALLWAPVTVIAGVLLWLTARRRQTFTLALAMLGAVVLDNALKLAIHRIRPQAFFGPNPDTYSFPSGHALFAICFYGALAPILAAEIRSAVLRTAVWAAAILMVVCIGLSRIYLGMHYPTDVLAGYLVGAAWLAALDGAGLFHFPHNLSSATQLHKS